MNKSEEAKGYQRGYQQALRKVWPLYRPPYPPDAVISGLIKALVDLVGVTDNYLATIDPDDPLQVEIGPAIDAGNEALLEVGKWLRDDPLGR